MDTKIENAIIESTMLGYEDHGILTAYIFVKSASWSCGFGGYGMDIYNTEKKRRVGHAFGIDFIAGILETVGAGSWEKLKGKHIRVEAEGWGGKIRRIGNIIEDKWFDPKALAEGLEEK